VVSAIGFALLIKVTVAFGISLAKVLLNDVRFSVRVCHICF
jgi:hypothetical protein